jgi:hypothetical protein
MFTESQVIEILVKCRLLFTALERGGFLKEAEEVFDEEIREVITDIHNFLNENGRPA